MSSPSTKETVRGLDKAVYLGTAIRSQLDVSTPRLEEAFGAAPPRGDGEPAESTGWREVQVRNANLIDQGVSNVQESSQDYRTAKIHLRDSAKVRDKASANLRQRYRAHQRIFEGSCGPRGLTLTGLDKPAETTLMGLREQVILVAKRYEDPALPAKLASIPKADTSGTVPELAMLAEEMRLDLAAYESALADWTKARKVRDEALVKRTEMRQRLREIVVNMARVQEGYYRVAGLGELADRLRLTVRRRSKPKTEEGGDASATGAPEGPASSAAAPDPVAGVTPPSEG